MKLFIYGVPGVGKTHASHLLAKRLKLPLLEADTLWKVAQRGKSPATHPFLFAHTCKAYQLIGPKKKINIIKGLREVRKAMGSHILRAIKKYPADLVAEASFLDPHVLSKLGTMILVVARDKARHEKQFFAHRDKKRNATEFLVARTIQRFLIDEARKNNIQLVETDEAADTISSLCLALR
jgi:2-phosphoglycerate kinase